jgi:hypothetical protein
VEQGLLYATAPMTAVTQAHMARFQANFMSMQAHKEWRAIAAQNGDAAHLGPRHKTGQESSMRSLKRDTKTRFDYGIKRTQPLRLLRHSK